MSALPTADEFAHLLAASRAGDQAAWQRLVGFIYADLRRVAHKQRRQGDIPTTLGTTGLVHECYLRLASASGDRIVDRNHFFNLASRVMRQVLCDYARNRLRAKRGAGQDHEDIEEIDVADAAEAEDLIALDDLLEQLDAQNPQWARVFECRFFAGLTDEETAAALDLTLRTAQRAWHDARDWLAQRLR